jgi:hypothetical protein
MIFATQLAIVLGVSAPSAPPSVQEEILQPEHRKLRGNQVGLDVAGGSLIGCSVGQTFIVGGRVTYYPIRHLGIGGVYGYSRGIGGSDAVRRRSVHYAHGQLELPLISALRVGRHKVLEMDLFGVGGAGAIYIARGWNAMGVIGGGVRIYPPVRWLAIRIDALTFLHHTGREPDRTFDTDVAFTLGLSFLLPSRDVSRSARRREIATRPRHRCCPRTD